MSEPSQTRLHAAHALLPGGWARSVSLAWDEHGVLTRVEPESAAPHGAPHAPGPLLPGLPNLHSHAFQRVFAGLTEQRAPGGPAASFWSWRDRMYRVALAVSPEQLEAIATQLYLEMLRAGYTSVCEFHYLHHDVHGHAHADPAEMAWRLVAAARATGIGLTLLPALYQHAGFGAAPPRAEQRRFIASVDTVLEIARRVRAGGTPVGLAPHSLRAVGPAALRELIAGADPLDAAMPLHIHIAEQRQEVADCIAWCGQRPVEWLLANAPVDARWCLVHATHLSDAERDGLATSGAVVGLCPSTEANLGDGVFDAAAYLAAGGAWGIGSDSHASVDAADELRLLELTQRLATERRNVLASDAHPGVAERLWLGAVAGGAQASGRCGAGPVAAASGGAGGVAASNVAGLAVGQPADFIALDATGVRAGLRPEQALACPVFARHVGPAPLDVWVGGRRVIEGGRHPLDGAAAARFVAARTTLVYAA